jgi:mono/diheme cytochrome c family protein
MQRLRRTIPRKVASLVAAALVAMSICSFAFGQDARADHGKTTNRANDSGTARGKYIVEGVAMCGQCHTPRDGSGAADRSHWLEGAPVWLKSAEPAEDWPLQAPRIAGTPPGTDAEMVKLLITGIWRDGKFLRPPMPQFRMNRQDAESVVAYLKSLQPAPR